MRLTVDDLKGPDVKKARLAYRCRVLVNGVEVKNCVVADEEQGYVVCHIVPSSLPNDRSLWPKSWPTETRRGKVEIIDPDKQ
jgi:hypothetical protein